MTFSLKFLEGFETGGVERAKTTAGAMAASTSVRSGVHGNYCLNSTITGGASYADFHFFEYAGSANTNAKAYGQWLYIPVKPTTLTTALQCRGPAASGVLWDVRLLTTGDGYFQVRDSAGSELILITPLSTGWHFFEFWWEDGSSSGDWEAKVNGVTLNTGSGADFIVNGGEYAEYIRLYCGTTTNFPGGTGLSHDDLYFGEATSANDLLGDLDIFATAGDGSATETGDTLLAGSMVNIQEIPSSDSNTASFNASGPVTTPVSPDTIAVQTNLTGSVTDIDDDPDSPDANWLTASGSSTLRVTFPTPETTPITGAGNQEFRVLLRKDATGPPAGTEDVLPNSLTSMVRYSGSHTDIDDDPDSPDGTFVYSATSPYDDPSMNINFTNPTNGGTINTATDVQTIEFYLDKASDNDADGTTGGSDPTFSAAIYDSGGLHETIATDVAVTGPAKFSYTWTASGISSADDVYIVFTTSTAGGGPNTRHVIVDACRWLMAWGTAETQPGYEIKLYENGSEVSAAGSATGSITDAGGDTVVSFTWDATNLGTADGSLVECYVNQTSGADRYIEIGAVEWNVYHTVTALKYRTITADSGALAGPNGLTELGTILGSLIYGRLRYTGSGSTLQSRIHWGETGDVATIARTEAASYAASFHEFQVATTSVPEATDYAVIGFERSVGTDVTIEASEVIHMVAHVPFTTSLIYNPVQRFAPFLVR